MKQCLDFNIRTQFTFHVNDLTFSCLLSGLAEQGVNINGFLQTIEKKRLNFVRMVVGYTNQETENDLRIMRKILRRLDVKFQEKPIIQLLDLPSDVPGQVNTIFGALWCNLQVNAMYIGEATNLYLDVSHIGNAIRILSQTDPEQCLKVCKRH
ncbi:hypothetical protein [Sutcliffiella halmapala]|uniref:hypothetical protein n=1 Tax=Sutcliffiella halmapala TaxID=79882 RepID=UPI000994DC37|nr:hypothetical protein [Sutcliffiella halmapala]